MSSHDCLGSLVAQMVNNPPACRRPRFGPWVGQSLGEGKATHSIIPAWRIPWTEEPGGLQPGATEGLTLSLVSPKAANIT